MKKRHVHAARRRAALRLPRQVTASAACRRSSTPRSPTVVGRLKKRRGGGDELLAYKRGGRWLDVRSADINAYLKDATGHDISAKDFRTWGATVLAARGARGVAARPHGTKTARKRAITRAVKEVAYYLGNTPAVARASYIDPRVFDRFRDGITIGGVLADSARTPRTAPRSRGRSRRRCSTSSPATGRRTRSRRWGSWPPPHSWDSVGDMSDAPHPITGRCLCGGVTYSADAEPIVQAACYCADCQRQTGNPFWVIVAVPRDALQVEGNTIASYTTVGEDHGGDTVRRFCSSCGSPIFSHAAAMPEVAFVKAGSLDDSSWLEDQRRGVDELRAAVGAALRGRGADGARAGLTRAARPSPTALGVQRRARPRRAWGGS